MKVLVLSDLHLGSRASRAAAGFEDLARVAAGFDRVILNGDTLDRCYTDPANDERAMGFINDVRKFCASRNGPPEFVTGNHDPMVSETHWIYDEPSQTLIFHGDCILDYTHVTKKADQELRKKLVERWDELGGRPAEFDRLHKNYRQVQRLHLPIINPYKKAKTVMQYALSLVYPPRRPFDILYYWMKAPERALATANGFDRPVKNIVVGHTHKPGNWRFGDKNVYNTGSYMPFSGAFACSINDDSVTYERIEKLAAAMPRVYALRSTAENSSLAGSQ